MNSLVIGFIMIILGVIIGKVFEYIIILIHNEINKVDINKLMELKDRGYKYFINGKDFVIYKRIKSGELIRELTIIGEGEKRGDIVAEMVEKKKEME